MSRFIHLRAHTSYSLLQGAIKIPDLITLAKAQNMPALAVTDHDNLFGSLEFSQACIRAGIQPIIGYTASVRSTHQGDYAKGHEKISADQLLLYAKDETGYANLLKLASLAYVAPDEGESPILNYDDVFAYAEGLLCLTAGADGGLCKLLHGQQNDAAEALLLRLKSHFEDRLYIEINRHEQAVETATEAALIDLALKHNLPLIATNQVYFADKKVFEAHDALRCVALGRYVSEENREILNSHYRFKTSSEMIALFDDIPEAIENTLHFAKRCHVFSPERAPILPGFKVTDEAGEILSESDALRAKAHEGLDQRLEKYVLKNIETEDEKTALIKRYKDRLDYELDVIITMKFPGYFLIVSDFIMWAKLQNIPVGPGRGSGAGSLVAWSLSITGLDPIAFGLIFERFLNPERVSMPDFDIDFCQDRRDEVIDYVKKRYGDDHVAQIITFGKLQARAVLRDVGRVLQMPYGQVDRICKLVPNNPANPLTLGEAIKLEPLLKAAIKEDETVAKLIALALQLEGLYRHASTHAAGVVIADRPLDSLVPLYKDVKSDMLVVQYSMKYAEMAGLVKFDFLGLKTLTVIQRCVDMLKARDVHVAIDDLPFDDKKTYAMMAKGDTLGVFQFESQGMQSALKELKPDCLEDLVALGALYRPGPMENIPTYIARKHGREKVDTFHPMLKEVLQETYGVIIYQEQVQKIAQIMAGYTLGAADLLRRAMGKKIKAEMDAQRAIFVKGAKDNGVSEAQASNIFDLVAKFAGYGFNKSHAAAYAVVAYQTAYLKANYPVEFMAASMNYEMNSTDKLSQFVMEAKNADILILPPDINASTPLFSVETTPDGALAVRYGLSAIKNVGQQAMAAILNERDANGAFASVHDMARRVDAHALNKRQLEHLCMAGSFDSLHANRRQVYESLDIILGIASSATQARESNQIGLFDASDNFTPVEQDSLKQVEDWESAQRLQQEFAAMGFYFSAHPMQAYEAVLQKLGVKKAVGIGTSLNAKYKPVKLAGVVQSSKIKASARGRFAFVALSDASGNFEISIFDETLLQESHDVLAAGTAVYIEADGKTDDQGTRLIARQIQSLDKKISGRLMRSVDFHIDEKGDLAALKRCLGDVQPNATQVHFHVKVSGGTLKLCLKTRYAVSVKTLQSLQAIENIQLKAA
jgi:DNA polymerase-3 subunit alpha